MVAKPSVRHFTESRKNIYLSPTTTRESDVKYLRRVKRTVYSIAHILEFDVYSKKTATRSHKNRAR